MSKSGFHAFVCYTEEDQGFVDKMTDTLESKPYKLNCFRPDRDILPGSLVMYSIVQHMEASRKILFVLSVHSVKSPWCRSQIQSILTDRGKDVAVVVVGDTKVPDYLKHLYTIQTASDEWMTKLTRFLGYIACFPCQREERETKAVVYCNNCRRGFCDPCQQQHRRQPDTHQHKTRDITDVDASPLTADTDCPAHHKPLELFCIDCNIAICCICCVVSHRQCSVSTLTESLSVLKQSLSTTKDKLSRNIDYALKHRAGIADVERKLSETKKDNQDRVQKEFSDMRTVLDKRERKMLEQIETVSQNNITKVHESIKRTENEIRSLRQKCEEITVALRSQSENTVYKTFSRCKDIKTDYQLLDLTENLTLTEIQVDTNFDKFQCELSVNEVQCSEMMDEDRKTGAPVLQNTLSLEDVGHIRDMCVVTQSQSDFIVMVSYNKLVHCFDTEKSKVISSLPVQSHPHSVTRLSDNRVAASLPFSHQILLVDVSPHLSIHSTHKTRKMYFGLSTLNPSTLVACAVPASLDMLDLTGRVLRSVCTDQQLATQLDAPWSLCMSRTGNILVSDLYNNVVLCVNDTGEEVFSYRYKGHIAASLKTNKYDNVFVNDVNKLVQLTSTGLYIRDVIRTGEDGVASIESLCFDSHGNMCVVLTDQKEKTLIRTYRFV